MVWWCSTRASIPAPALAASSVIPADRRPQIRGWGEGIGTLCRKSLIPKRDTTSHENVADPITNDLRGYFQGNFVGNFVDSSPDRGLVKDARTSFRKDSSLRRFQRNCPLPTVRRDHSIDKGEAGTLTA